MSDDAILLYHKAIEVIALASMYSVADVKIAVTRLRGEFCHPQYDKNERLALHFIIKAIECAAFDPDEKPKPISGDFAATQAVWEADRDGRKSK